jgi:signal transduction histidine kinase
MLDSLRARLLIWYALILALIVLVFATTVCYLFWRSLVQDIDRDLGSAANVIAQALRPAASGVFDFELARQYRETEFVDHEPYTFYAVFDREGGLIDRSDPDVDVTPRAGLGSATRAGRRELAAAGPNGAVVIVGRDLSDARRRVAALAGTIAAVGGIVLLLSLSGGWFLAGRALAPVSRISRAATLMSRGDLAARIPIEQTENELEQLASTLNDAFDRLGLAADAQRRFTADASHELRTPLATMAAEVEWALARPRSAGEYRQTIETCSRAADRMRRIVDGLLTLARSERTTAARREPLDLAPLVDEAIALLAPLARQRGIVIETHVEPSSVLGDRDQIAELIMNLLENAVEYNREGGRVIVEARPGAAGVELTVSDTGVGIAADDLPHVFERFYRADRARSRRTGGAGLGLAIARRIVEGHQGEIACRSEVGRGTTISVRLPSGAPAAYSAPCA